MFLIKFTSLLSPALLRRLITMMMTNRRARCLWKKRFLAVSVSAFAFTRQTRQNGYVSEIPRKTEQPGNGATGTAGTIGAEAISSAAAVAGPTQEYSRRLDYFEAETGDLHRKHIWTGNARVVVFVGILALCWKIGKTGSPSVYWLVAVVLLFIGLVVVHRRFLRALARSRRAAEVYRRGLARIEDRWVGTGETGEAFATPDHLYAEDLDILGNGSLFQLLCTARTRMGKRRLADYLLEKATLQQIMERQQAVAELKSKPNLREDLAVMGDSDHIEAEPAALSLWADEKTALKDGLWWAAALALLNIAALIYGFMVLWTPFVVCLIVNGSIMFSLRDRLAKVFAGLDKNCKNLDELAQLLRRIETEKFESPRLQQLQTKLMTGGMPPSECIARLDTLSDLEDSRHNMIVRLFDVPLLYSLQVAFALERWRKRFGSGITAWLDVVGEIEALVAIATYAYEHPQDPFPEFAPGPGPACFAGEALGHPLLPSDKCVRNDVDLGGKNQILLVSGSNMSGKSTYLRVVGINAVLAMSGAPVRARRLRLSPLSVGASMRISDSLQKGVSHFYAEINRIRQVVDLTASYVTLFLLDEILHGTNSHDRRAGTEGILRTLIRNGAIGLVTTHDLALTSIEQIFPDRIQNVHFQEKFESDRLSFDYRLRQGVVTTSNGLELMKSIGLDVS